MILIGQYDSPFVRRVAVTLHHYALPFERRITSVFRDFDELLTINPLGKVPVLELDDGEYLFDSRMILDYLDGLVAPENRLTPIEQPCRRRVQRIDVVALGLMEKSVELRTETVRKVAQAQDQRWVNRLRRQIDSALSWLEAQQPSPWLYGDRMTQADVTAALAYTNLRQKLPEVLSERADIAIAKLCNRCEALPEFLSAAYSHTEAALTPGHHQS